MIKHERRAHQHEIRSEDIIDLCDTESDIAESPHTPRRPAVMTWPVEVTSSGGAASTHSTGLVQQHGQYTVSHGYQCGPIMPTANAISFDMSPVSGSTGVQVLHDLPAMNQARVYMTEQRTPDIVAMNTNAIPRTFYSRQHQDDLARVDISCAPVHEIHLGDQHSPADLSATSYQSSHISDDLLSGQTASSTASSSFCDATSADECPPLDQYKRQLSQQMSGHQPMQFPSQEAASTFQIPPPTVGVRSWAEYQAPIEVATIGHLPIFGSGFHSLFLEPKLDFEDPSMQLPSARLESF
ncbi:hypothetical protein ACRE_024040 [Hapsidospora chrysogenum ATCC 11550]|uniref:Uncharacterized protein n=1 Tax=Hapsidospora chrysogenum (strain ATCC 11550 / CBS 779.69 / DSM 880 / IAM 14645 / JCM 23072 / IMI 49137) TaxID=857340 RepID=A0A086TBN3_HAPC1|nr:hypothetical protein ACRE_024040 [Hapsidospora chrysogenum ATCC 11550]